MSKISFDDVIVSNDQSSSTNNQVGFFNLKNDGDEAVVRFMIDSVDDMEILTVHDIRVDGRFRQVSCLRDPRDPMENCPLCAKGENVKQVIFLKMLQYENTPNGIEAKPVVWQRNANTYAFRIKGYLDNYGPLSNILCKIVRHGASGDMKTTYDIIPNLSPTQFPQENYPINADAFKNYSALGTVVIDRNKDDINTFISTGNFPQQNTQSPTNNFSNTTGDNYPEHNPQGPAYDETPWNSGPNSPQPVTMNNTESVMGKPNRYY